MKTLSLSALVLVLAVCAFAQDVPADAGSGEKKGPVLFGDGGGRIWKWDSGEKTFLTPEGRNLVLGGVGEKELWGWSVDGDQARFFTLQLPQKKEKAADPAASKAADPAASKAAKKEAPAVPVFEKASYPVPDRADRVGNRLLLAYGVLSGQARWELWQAGKKTAAKAYDDGRTVYALAVGPLEGWMVAGRSADGSPWLELSGEPVEVPEGWRGRLTVAAWVEEKKDDAKDAPSASPAAPKDEKKKPVPTHPWAAGWGAPGSAPPRALFWGPEGWSQPDPGEQDPLAAPGVYPLLGHAGEGTLALAGWQADSGTGTLRPWFWDGLKALVPGGSAEGLPQAFSTSGKGGPFLIVRHQSAPWFTQEDGKESQPLEGLGGDDRVVSIEPEAPKTGP